VSFTNHPRSSKHTWIVETPTLINCLLKFANVSGTSSGANRQWPSSLQINWSSERELPMLLLAVAPNCELENVIG